MWGAVSWNCRNMGSAAIKSEVNNSAQIFLAKITLVPSIFKCIRLHFDNIKNVQLRPKFEDEITRSIILFSWKTYFDKSKTWWPIHSSVQAVGCSWTQNVQNFSKRYMDLKEMHVGGRPEYIAAMLKPVNYNTSTKFEMFNVSQWTKLWIHCLTSSELSIPCFTTSKGCTLRFQTGASCAVNGPINWYSANSSVTKRTVHNTKPSLVCSNTQFFVPMVYSWKFSTN